MSHQLPYVVRHFLARHLEIPETDVRVIAPQTGGGFGQKASIYPEEFVCAYLSRMLRRPIKWVEDRLENMVASTHARDQDIELEAAFDKDGKILALRSNVWVDVGAYSTYLWSAGMEPLQTAGLMPGPLQSAGAAIQHARCCHKQNARWALSGSGPSFGVGVTRAAAGRSCAKTRIGAPRKSGSGT